MPTRIVTCAAALLALTGAAVADPVEFRGHGVVTAAPATGCPNVGTVAEVTYRIAFGDRPDSLFVQFDWAGRELRPKGRTTFAAKGTATFAEANGWGFWTGDVAYSAFAVTPATNTARANTIRVRITHVQPDGKCKITLDAGLARQG